MRRNTRTTLLALALLELLAAPPADAAWRPLGLSGHHVSRLHVHSGFLYACTSDGLHRISIADPDTLWALAGFPGESVLDLIGIGPQTLLAAKALTATPGDTVSLFRSINGGVSWQPFQNGFGAGSGSSGRQARRLLALEGSPGTILATSGRIEKSTDAGLSWRVVTQAAIINAIEQSSSNPNLLWGGGETAIFWPYVLKSSDAGESWKQINLFAGGDNAVDAIAASPFDSSVVYLGMEGRVMKSEDAGSSWWATTSPDPSMYTFGMAIRPHTPLKIYAAGASFTPDPRGVVFHRSLDGGLSWRAFTYPADAGNGVDHLVLRAAGTQETLFVATGNGVFRYDEVVTGAPASEGLAPALLRSSPNPFTRDTAFEFMLAGTEDVSLRVLDVRGRVAATLVRSVLAPGPHRVSWDASNAAAGIYFAQLRSGGRVRSAKLLHLR